MTKKTNFADIFVYAPTLVLEMPAFFYGVTGVIFDVLTLANFLIFCFVTETSIFAQLPFVEELDKTTCT